MKKNRLFALLFLFCLFCTLLSPLALAAPAEKGLIRILGIPTARRGDEITFEVELNRNPGITNLRLQLQYDRAALELLSAEDKGLLPNADFTDSVTEEKFVLHWRSSSELVQTGRLCTLSFRVKTDAPYSTAGIALTYSDAEFDIVDHNHNRVPFEIEAAPFTVPCLHPDAQETVLREATLERAGERRIFCKVCEAEVIQEILPTLESADKNVKATVLPGEWTKEAAEGEEGKAPAVFLEKITSGSDFDKALLSSAAFSGTATDVFQIRFTRGGEAFVPLGAVRLVLSKEKIKTDENSVLYRINPAGKAEKVPFETEADGISFFYSDSLYFLMDASLPPLKEEPVPPSAEPTPPATEPAPAEENSRPPLFFFGVGGGLLLLVLAALFFFLRRPKKDKLD